MERRCPNCNDIPKLYDDYYHCPRCGTRFPRYEIAEPLDYYIELPIFELTSRMIMFIAGFIFALISYLGFLGLSSTADESFPYTIIAFVSIFWIASIICLTFSFAPNIVNNYIGKHSNLDLIKFKHVIAFLILILVFLWVIGFQLIVQAVYIYESLVIKNKSVDYFLLDTADQLSLGPLLIDLSLNLLIMGIGIIAFVFLVYGDKHNPLEYLKIKLNLDKMMYGLGIGLVVGIILFVISGIAFFVLGEMGLSQENKIADKLSDLVGQNLLYIFIIAAFAAISEEIFFRGFLQKHIGLIPAAIIFGVIHMGYLTFTQVAGPFILGIVWGLLLKKTDNLAAPIASHFIINFLSFLVLASN